MTLCICGHEERHHDNEASRCDKIGCGCELFDPDWAMLEAQYRDLARACAALTAERDGLARQVKDLEELRDYLRNALQDEAGIQKNMHEANAYLARERKKAEAALAKNAKDLSRLVKAWRDEASGHYCQTYNTEQAKGLNIAANMLNEYVKELERRTERQDKPPAT